jgi:anthranilate/para-aminobenzoate synthase component I
MDLPTSFLRTYHRLRDVSPGDYGALLRLGELKAACVSPERFVEVDGHRVVARPMKGTRLRRHDEPHGAALLAASEKDRAENVMIVDLMRNDLGRVCEVGSVEVPALFEVETYETVHQMTSTVCGQLRGDVGPFGLLAAIFPPGSMSGAPKVEACRVLAEFESEHRGIYGGTIGWLGFDGRWTFSVVIRALQAWLGRARWDVGGGITALSDADAEYDEAMAKARPLAALTEPAERTRRARP